MCMIVCVMRYIFNITGLNYLITLLICRSACWTSSRLISTTTTGIKISACEIHLFTSSPIIYDFIKDVNRQTKEKTLKFFA